MTGPKYIHAGGDLLGDIAFFVKAHSIYPPGHSRIQAAGDRLLTTIRDRVLKLENRVVLLFRKHEVFVDGAPRGISHPVEKWLLHAARKARIGGLEITRAVTFDSLGHLAATIVGSGLRGQASTFSRDATSGIRVFDLSYSGRHKSGELGDAPAGPDAHTGKGRGAVTTRGSDNELMRRLEEDPTVAELIERLVGRMSEEFETSPTDVEVDLVPRIVALVTADAGYDLDQAVSAIVSTLERLEKKLPAWAAAVRAGHSQPGGELDEELSRIASRIARRYFSRDVQLVVQDDANLPSGRPGDEVILDELAPLLEEVQALPDSRSRTARLNEHALRGHVATIWTHLIADPILPETPERATVRLKAMLDEHPDTDLSHLRAYGGAAAGGDPKASARVVSAFLRHGLATHLVKYGAIGHLHLAASFPDGFIDWVRALPDGPQNLPAFLGQALRAIPPDALHRGVARLLADRVFTQELFQIMLSCKVAEMLLVFDVITSSRNSQAIGHIVGAMRTVPLPVPQGSAVEILPMRWLPDSHVMSMCRLLLSRADAASVREEAERLLRAYSRSNSHEPDDENTCVRAIEALARFPSGETRATLKEIARHPLLGGTSPRAIRRAAKGVLRQFGGRRVPRTT